ncbi:hypothetical protein ACQP3D_28185, partial [Escherichia coli]
NKESFEMPPTLFSYCFSYGFPEWFLTISRSDLWQSCSCSHSVQFHVQLQSRRKAFYKMGSDNKTIEQRTGILRNK